MPLVRLGIAAGMLAALALPLAAQQWNGDAALTLVSRAIARRSAVQADTALRSYRTRAHGFVFFLAQAGSGLNGPPRLVKADEIAVEVYWQAPDRSKQVIRGWRDGRYLPTDIHYHRDHLGIVTSNFGDLIRIGEGDEVRDAVHPLSPAGREAYDFALVDSLSIQSAAGQVRVYEVRARPKDYSRPLVIGTLFLSAETAELVRFRFSFTPKAYRDADLEDISVVLEQALWEGRFWLPYRQEIEIRRRSSWFDFPARGIIRGRWEITDYDLNAELAPELLAGAAIDGLKQPTPDDTLWTRPLDEAIDGAATPASQEEMARVRAEVARAAGSRALSGLASRRLAASSISDLVRVNRVQGLALGFGASLGLGNRRLRLLPSIGYGTSDGRVTGGLALEGNLGTTTVAIGAGRRLRDFSDIAVVAPVLNSLASQETGRDYGDYVLLESVQGSVRRPLSPRTALGLTLGVERSRSVAVAATPAHGSYRPNPSLGAGRYRVARLEFGLAPQGLAARRSLGGSLSLEAGDGPTSYARASAAAEWRADLGRSELRARAHGGVGSSGLPGYRRFAIGGRGTLVGEPFRAYGGRSMLLGHLEWRVPVSAPAVPLGTFASTGDAITLAPFVAAGWTDRADAGLPWVGSNGVRPVTGLAAEIFMGLFRVEAGVGLRDGKFGVTVDLGRDWWEVL